MTLRDNLILATVMSVTFIATGLFLALFGASNWVLVFGECVGAYAFAAALGLANKSWEKTHSEELP